MQIQIQVDIAGANLASYVFQVVKEFLELILLSFSVLISLTVNLVYSDFKRKKGGVYKSSFFLLES